MSVKVTLNLPGFAELRNSPGVKDALNQVAERIAAAAGEGFSIDRAEDGVNRADAQVYADTFEAKKAQAENHTLERAFGSV